ncbi:MAG TPA: SBBP repeat-containing protein, partial [Candidatus Bathyarchaeia archaeon]|nr:SBBP repeat-containing protein [Candidatus Bathyarchaeia archaeon]
MDPAVSYYVEGRETTVYFTPDGLTLALAGDGDQAVGTRASRWVVKLDFVGAEKGVVPEGLESSGTRVSVFRGKPNQWRAGLRASSKLVYRDLWPGIDLVYSGSVDRLKYEFVVRPGADPSKIAMAYRGADGVSLTADGRLAVRTPAGGFEDDAPVAWQETADGRREVRAAYDLESATFGFSLGEYDRGQTLVIDPSSLIYCGFIGGSGAEAAGGIAVDGEGAAYISGSTNSSETTFPVNTGPGLAVYQGFDDAFVAKVSPDGTHLVYCAYIGGAGTDRAAAVAVDALGSAYIAGYTDSPESTFPVVVGPDLTANGSQDAFVAKLDPSGTSLVYCGYIGGAGTDYASGLAVDSAGAAYVCGTTYSDERSFPVKAGPDLTLGGVDDAFVAKVDPSGTSLAYCGYIGGIYQDSGSAVAVDGFGNAYITGNTMSSESDGFPVVVGPDLTYAGALWTDNAFVAKIAVSGAAFDYCGYFPEYLTGSSGSYGRGVAVEASGSAYIVGYSVSTNGKGDGFVIKVLASGASIDRGGPIAGTEDDRAEGIALDAEGSVYVTGTTSSYPPFFPAYVGPSLNRLEYLGRSDAFITKLNSSLTRFIYSGFIGGESSDHGKAVAVDSAGAAFVVGTTADGDWARFPAITGPDLSWNGGDADVFVAKVRPVPEVSHPTLISVSPPTATAAGSHLTIRLEGTDFVYGAIAYWKGSPRPTTLISDAELSFEVFTNDLSDGGTAEIYLRNPDGEAAGPVHLQLNNPIPVLDSFSPPAGTAGGSADLRLLGSDFVVSSRARWNGEILPSGYTGPGALLATIPAADLATGGEFEVSVVNPAPEGGVSATLTYRIATFALSAPAPSA